MAASARALFDSGAQNTYVVPEVARLLDRANARLRLFKKAGDFAAFERRTKTSGARLPTLR